MTLSNREHEKPSGAASGFDFSRSSWLDFRNFASFDKVGYKISKLDGIISKIKQRDSSIFRKVIMAMQTQDVEKARSLSSELLVLINSGVKRYEIYRNIRKSNHLKKSSDRNTKNRKIDRKSDPHY